MITWIGTGHAGVLCDAEDARIPASDGGYTQGLGVFETMRVESDRAFLLPWHLERMRRGAARIGIDLPGDDALRDIVAAVIAANPLPAQPIGSRSPSPQRVGQTAEPASAQVRRLRLTASAGAHGPTLVCTLAPLDLVPSTAHLATSPWRRNERSALVGVKSTSYAELALAQRSAVASGATDALLLNTVGELAECATANLFVLSAGALRTPPESAGILPGIGRRFVLTIARSLSEAIGEVREETLARDDLAAADGAFCVSALRGIRPVTTVDARAIPCGAAIAALAAAYAHEAAAEWCWT